MSEHAEVRIRSMDDLLLGDRWLGALVLDVVKGVCVELGAKNQFTLSCDQVYNLIEAGNDSVERGVRTGPEEK